MRRDTPAFLLERNPACLSSDREVIAQARSCTDVPRLGNSPAQKQERQGERCDSGQAIQEHTVRFCIFAGINPGAPARRHAPTICNKCKRKVRHPALSTKKNSDLKRILDEPLPLIPPDRARKLGFSSRTRWMGMKSRKFLRFQGRPVGTSLPAHDHRKTRRSLRLLPLVCRRWNSPCRTSQPNRPVARHRPRIAIGPSQFTRLLNSESCRRSPLWCY